MLYYYYVQGIDWNHPYAYGTTVAREIGSYVLVPYTDPVFGYEKPVKGVIVDLISEDDASSIMRTIRNP